MQILSTIDTKLLSSRRLAANLVDIAIRRGGNIDRLLRGTQLFKEDLAKRDHQLSVEQWLKLVDNCQKQTHSPDLALLLGRRLSTFTDSCFEQLLANPRNLGRALTTWSCYFNQDFKLVYCHLSRKRGQLAITFNAAFTHNEAAQFILEVTAAAFHFRMKRLFSANSAFQYCFSCQPPAHADYYYQTFGSQTRFAQGINQILIDDSVLHQTPVDSNALFRQSQLRECRSERKRRVTAPTIIQSIDYVLRQNAAMTLEECALTLGVSNATLKRRLKAHKTTYLKLLDQHRLQCAVELLGEETAITTQTLGQSLGFNDRANFRRAFKRWTGKTPSDFRLNQP